MATVLDRIQRASRHRRRRADERPAHVRLDIQGLRMVAVVLVIVDHLFGWPRGGFIGVDVFFVISGFLITGILFRDAEKLGRVSFLAFYRRRIRRIVPAATLTLTAICVAALVLFNISRATTTWWDSLWAFLFASNWRFALQGTNYFTADGPISPVRHFWSLSVEEQFYFVWPAIIAVIVFVVARKALSGGARRTIAGAIMAVLVGASFAWALVNTANDPAWSYYSTFTRAWELGFGALIAIFAANMAKIPNLVRPVISWLGLALILFGAFWITENIGFPGPWAIIPVAGSALVIIAGAGAETPVRFLLPITNPVSVIIGDLSYSLYLWHWPVIIFLGVYTEPAGWQFYACALGLTTALATLAYYFVEQPILTSSWLKPRGEQEWRSGHRSQRSLQRRLPRSLAARLTFTMTPSRSKAALIGCAFLAVGLGALAALPPQVPKYISAAAVDAPAGDANLKLPPAVSALQERLAMAAKAQEWPV